MTWQPRYTVLAILVAAWLLCYMDRMVMASAIPFIARDFHLSPLAMGQVLSAFFVGYALMQIPGGLLADRFGPRIVLAISVGWWSIMTAVTGAAPGMALLLVSRVAFGLGEGPFPASSSKTLSIWFPRSEIARAQGLQMAATAVGATIAPLFVTTLILHWGWREVFYSLSLPGLIVALVLWWRVRNSPDGKAVTGTPTSAAFLQSLKTPAVLWCAASLFLSNIVAWGLMNWLPTYLLTARGFDVAKMGIFAALANLAGAVGCPLGGWLCDRYFRDRLRVPIIGCLLVGGVFTYLAAIAPTGEWAVAALAVVFISISGIANTATFTLPIVLVPKEAVGGAFGIVNTAGQIAGVLSPLLIGYLLNVTGNNFQVVLYTMVALALAAVVPASRIRQ